ncbi:MAG: hypothetical protein RMJ17_01980, partial [Candidatus Aenigmarchaeota archaeon]|nr:hypothetical protein [Candidatus Aenigmarchaeota archaeon]MDW8149344.1 hypothetical protein [Candidatus Aenigmarchaeota archaeon]
MARKNKTVIYRRLYNIWKKQLDELIYRDGIDLKHVGIYSYLYGDFSPGTFHERFLEVKENAKKFFTNFDFFPLLDELKKANYIENFLKKKLYGTYGVYANSENYKNTISK